MTEKEVSIKILVGYHKPAHLLKNDVFVPVNGGRTQLEENYRHNHISKDFYDWMINNTIADNLGDNISQKNLTYNEMTILYWAWKNYKALGNPDYIGFEHYRRNFIFDEYQQLSNSSWTIDYDYPDDEYNKRLNNNVENIQKYLNQFDCLHSFIKLPNTVYEQYKMSQYHDIKDLDIALQYIKDNLLSYYQSAKKYVNGENHYFCNMFIMKKNLFFEYCDFIFPILEYISKNKDEKYLSSEEKRMFISERLTGMFIQNLIDRQIPCCPLNITLLKNTDVKANIQPAFTEKNIPVVFSLDNAYVPYFATTLLSLLDNISDKYNYDLLVLNNQINEENKSCLQSMVRNYSNVKLRFIDITPYLAEIDKKKLYIEIHVSIATYFRFFIAEIFKNYSKVLYLDTDIIILNDIARLYNEKLEDKWIAAVGDIRESIPVKLNLSVSNRNWKNYVTKTLGVKDPYKYFQAGVLIFNIKKFIENDLQNKLFSRLNEIKRPILSDQDILNSVCYDHVHFLPTEWNIEWQIPIEYPEYKKILPQQLFNLYQQGLKTPSIIHYASSRKPWNERTRSLANIWWQYARLTPFYEEILFNQFSLNTMKNVNKVLNYSEKKIRYLRYKILSKITFGKMRQHYKRKKKEIKVQLKEVKKLLK